MSHMTTPEEYLIQEYEGAATRFGQWTLDARKQELDLLAQAMVAGSVVEPGLTPPDLEVCVDILI